jgi:hypothetical protein
VQAYCFVDPLQKENMRPFRALSLELLVLTSEDLGLQFVAAFVWIYMSKTRRLCKAAVMGLYELAVARFHLTVDLGKAMPWRQFPAVEKLNKISRLVKLVNLFYFFLFSKLMMPTWAGMMS